MFAQRIREIIKRAGRNWYILVSSLLLAAFMWVTQKFSEEYSSTFNYNLTINTAIPGRARSASARSALRIKGTATGYYLLQKNYTTGYDNLELSVNPRLLFHAKGDEFLLPGPAIKSLAQDALGEKVTIEWITTDTLQFDLPEQYNKKVAVVPMASLKFESQHMQTSPLKLTPDSVLVYGPKLLLKNIDSVYTSMLDLNNLNSSTQGLVKLSGIKGASFSDDEVAYSIEVSRYVENTITLPITVVNAPDGMDVTVIPKNVELRYRVRVPGRARFTAADFKATINLASLESASGDVARVLLTRVPNEIIWHEFNHKFVEFIVK